MNRGRGFAELAKRLAAACQPGADMPDPVLREMARAGEEQILHFTHPGRARDDAVALFWQAVPLALADPEAVTGGAEDPAATAERMVAAVRATSIGRDFGAVGLPEALFRAVMTAMLEVPGRPGA